MSVRYLDGGEIARRTGLLLGAPGALGGGAISAAAHVQIHLEWRAADGGSRRHNLHESFG